MSYDIKKYESLNDEKFIKNFHKSRVAFLIYNNKIMFLENSELSHFEWAKSIGISKMEFNELTRGYCYKANIIFYKGDFSYDKKVENDALKYCLDVLKHCNLKHAKIYVGVRVGVGKIWPPDKFLREINIK